MKLTSLINDAFGVPDTNHPNWVPAENISRQEWQEAVVALMDRIRRLTDRPAFGLTDAEISINYHQPLQKFRLVLEKKLGIPSRG